MKVMIVKEVMTVDVSPVAVFFSVLDCGRVSPQPHALLVLYLVCVEVEMIFVA